MAKACPPSWRKGTGIALILAVVVLWAGAIVLFAPYIGRWPVLVQALFYLVVGIVWIIPLKPLLHWSQSAPGERANEASQTGLPD